MPDIIEIARDTKFEAAHYLPHVPATHKCSRMHGHTYRLTAIWRGPIEPDLGWVTDFGELRDMLAPLLKQVDHHLLNDLVDNPTCENMLVWLWQEITNQATDWGLGVQLAELRLRETDTSWATYRGDTAEDEVDRSWRAAEHADIETL